jgi:hypothetical protein
MRQKTIYKDKAAKPIRRQEKEKVFNPSKLQVEFIEHARRIILPESCLTQMLFSRA